MEDFCRRQHIKGPLHQGVPRDPRSERKAEAIRLDEESGQVSPHFHKATATDQRTRGSSSHPDCVSWISGNFHVSASFKDFKHSLLRRDD